MNAAVLLAGLVAAQSPERILIDTDPGDFTDDNIALVMCVRSPERVSILGVTAVAGNVWAPHGAASARRTLRLLGQNTPVHLGAQQPLVHTREMSQREGPLDFAGAFATPKPGSRRETAVEFMIRTLEREPEGVTLLAIGPLTNVARVLQQRPDLAAKVRRLVIMGGNVYVPGNASKAAEFNFWFDPEAARIVLRSGIPKNILFGLDICNKVVLTREIFESVVRRLTPITRLYRDSFGNGFPGFYKNPNATGFLWDELAAAYLIDPAFVTRSETRYLDVETTFGPRYGATLPLNAPPAPGATAVEVMLDADVDRVVNLYRKLLTQTQS
ncbi:MAG: nucleoside hydrolase [Bryobacterales bacterium]|nr:nucleoside hydrolase [Bryobacterales bacterium]